jgi:hypothetical protein
MAAVYASFWGVITFSALKKNITRRSNATAQGRGVHNVPHHLTG